MRKLPLRMLLFFLVNLLIIVTIGLICNLFHLTPIFGADGSGFSRFLLFCLMWGMGGSLISLLLSKSMAKWFMGVRIIDPARARGAEADLLRKVSRLSQKMGLGHVPEVGIYEANEMNAFATGASERGALLAVSTRLLSGMDEESLEGVLGHELAHIYNGDMITLALIQGSMNVFVIFFSRIFASILSGNSRKEGSWLLYTFWTFLLEVVFMCLASMVVAWFSRHREFRADKGSADLVGKGKMIKALQALDRDMVYAASGDASSEKMFEAFCISSKNRKRSLLREWFATHPPLEERINRLRLGGGW